MGQIVKVSTSTPVVVTPFVKDVAAIALGTVKAAESWKVKMHQLIQSKYGAPVLGKDGEGKETRSGGPTFEQYKEDRAGLKQVAKDRKLADDQVLRKAYCKALTDLYGSLPVAQTPEALRKAEERKAAQQAVEALRKARESDGTAPQSGAVKGETSDRQPSPQEQIESLVARIGVFETLEACINLLAADESTAGQATHLRKMAAAAKAKVEEAKKATAAA